MNETAKSGGGLPDETAKPNGELVSLNDKNLPALPASQSKALMQMIQGAVANPEMKTDVIEKLWEMQKESDDRDAKAAYAKAKAAAQKEMPTSVAANQTNDHTHSRYADLDAVTAAVVPIYSKHGFSMAFDTIPSTIDNCLTIICELEHKLGYSKKYRLNDWPIDATGLQGTSNKTRIQGLKSTLSYAQRTLTCLIWNLATGSDNDGNSNTRTGDDDNNSRSEPQQKNGGAKATENQVNFMSTKFNNNDAADWEGCKKHFGIEVLDDVLKQDVNNVIKWIEAQK